MTRRNFPVWFIIIVALISCFFPGAANAGQSVRVGIYTSSPLVFPGPGNKGAGLFPEILQWVAAREGWNIAYVHGSFEECLSRLSAGQIDIACAVAFTPDRAGKVSFGREPVLINWGEVYRSAQTPVLDLTDLEGKRVALLKKDIYNTAFREFIKGFGITCEFVETDDYHRVLDLVSTGDAHAGVVNRLFGDENAGRYDSEKTGVIFNPTRLFFAFRPGLPADITAALDTHLSAMKQNQASVYYAALGRWIGQAPSEDAWPLWFRILISAGLAAIGILVVGTFFLRSQVRRKTIALTRALEKRTRAETDLRTTLHAIGDAVIATDAQGSVALMNPVAESLTGWPVDRAKGMPFSRIFRTIDNTTGFAAHDPVAKVLETGNPAALDPQATLVSRQGNTFRITDSASPIRDTDGRLRGVVTVFRDITETANLEASIRHNKDYLDSIFRASPIGIGVVRERNIVQVNQKFLDMTGYTQEELIGSNARILYAGEAEYTHVGTEKYRQIKKYGTGTVETIWVKKDGTRIHVLLSSTPLDRSDLARGVTFSALDITLRKHAELQLKKSERQYRTLFEKSNDAIFLISADSGQYLDANAAARKLTGRPLEALAESNINDHTAPYRHSEPLSLTAAAQRHLGEFTFTRPDKTTRIARIITVPLSPEVIIAIAKDVTHDLYMENQLRQAQKMESIGTLAGGIAHDFNNILFPIMGFAEILLSDVPQDSPLRHGLDQIYASATRAKELVAQILAFSRQSVTAPGPIKLQPIIKEALKLLRATIPTTIDIKQSIDRGCGAVKADPTQIHQIIINLTTNAYHAMEKTGGTLTVTLEKKEGPPDLPGHPEIIPGAYACLTVTDTGPGIPEEIQHNIFDPFFTTKEKGKGTGMGLSVVHGIVMGLGGALRMQNLPGCGAAFYLYFPLVNGNHPPPEEHKEDRHLVPGSERVLLVDDEPEIISMEIQMLRRLGYRVTASTRSLEALSMFTEDPGKFDLVISDVAMPGMAGDQLARAMMKIRPDIPILLCTGFSETMNAEKAAAMGVRGFILKPMMSRELSAKIRKVLRDNVYQIGEE
ncbi:MAG: PAS domain S-box protein [Desulfobacter sp.]